MAVIKLFGHAVCQTPEYPASVTAWAKLKNIPVKGGKMTLWKTTKADGTAFHNGTTAYGVGITTVAADWDADYKNECGAGLHLADSPSAARIFVPSDQAETFRLFSVSVAVKDCRCFPGQPQFPMKLRARQCIGIKEYPRDYMEPF